MLEVLIHVIEFSAGVALTRWPWGARVAIYFFAIGIITCFAALWPTGVNRFRGVDDLHLHQWIGHALVAMAWLCAPAGVVVAHQSHRRWLRCTALTSWLLLIVLVKFGFEMGYHDALGQAASEDTYYQFIVVHCWFVPIVGAAATITGLLLTVLQTQETADWYES